ncbi:MAG: hypothetical protein ABUL63_05040, partial [Acidobacteriota bacterium]
FLLIPTSPTHFRVEGLPPGHEMDFQLVDGRGTVLTHRQPGRPELMLTRSESGSAAEPPRQPGDPEVAVAQADLERLQGSYANQEMGFAFQVDLVGSRLRLSFVQGPAFPPTLLTPTSPTHFRVEGEGLAPGLALAFHVTEGKANALSILQPGKPEVVMKRQ